MAGASNAIAGEIIGQDSAAISRGYTHIETDALRKAVDAMPDILPNRRRHHRHPTHAVNPNQRLTCCNHWLTAAGQRRIYSGHYD